LHSKIKQPNIFYPKIIQPKRISSEKYFIRKVFDTKINKYIRKYFIRIVSNPKIICPKRILSENNLPERYSSRKIFFSKIFHAIIHGVWRGNCLSPGPGLLLVDDGIVAEMRFGKFSHFHTNLFSQLLPIGKSAR